MSGESNFTDGNEVFDADEDATSIATKTADLG
jgi:hypothetical protein